jgi:hypothetical protein
MKYPGCKLIRTLLAAQIVYNFAREVERFRPDYPFDAADTAFVPWGTRGDHH